MWLSHVLCGFSPLPQDMVIYFREAKLYTPKKNSGDVRRPPGVAIEAIWLWNGSQEVLL